jgi:hypothetical protein
MAGVRGGVSSEFISSPIPIIMGGKTLQEIAHQLIHGRSVPPRVLSGSFNRLCISSQCDVHHFPPASCLP